MLLDESAGKEGNKCTSSLWQFCATLSQALLGLDRPATGPGSAWLFSVKPFFSTKLELAWQDPVEPQANQTTVKACLEPGGWSDGGVRHIRGANGADSI